MDMNARKLLDEIFDVPLRQRLLEAVPILVPEVRRAYLAWTRAVPGGVLIGALAAGVYSEPRTTRGVDMLFLNDAEVPEQVVGFKRVRAHAFEHRETGVEIEVLTPEFLRLPPGLVRQIFDTAQNGVASAAGVIAAKLQRASLRDQGDIQDILGRHPEVSLEGWPLTPAQSQILSRISSAPPHSLPE